MGTILVLTDKFSLGGLETHLYTYFKRLKEFGVKIIFLSNFDQQPYFSGIDLYADKIVNLDLDPRNLQISQIFKKVDGLIKSHNIDIIHAHPYYSIYVGFLLACHNNIPFVLTLHGKNSLFSPDNASNIFLENIIFKNSRILTVNKTLYDTISDKCKSIHFLPNPIDEDIFCPSYNAIRNNYILVVTRLDEDKIISLKKTLSNILPILSKKNISLKIAGEGSFKEDIQNKYSQYILERKLELLGAVDPHNLADLMRRSKAVIGMGRVILESIFTQSPSVLMGYDGIVGLVDIKLFKEASCNNFNGNEFAILPERQYPNLIESLIVDGTIYSEVGKIRNSALGKYSSRIVVQRYLNLINKTYHTFTKYDSTIQKMSRLYYEYCLLQAAYRDKLDLERQLNDIYKSRAWTFIRTCQWLKKLLKRK